MGEVGMALHELNLPRHGLGRYCLREPFKLNDKVS